MKKYILPILLFLVASQLSAQKVMTPELLWQVKKVSALGISSDGASLIYKVSVPDMAENKFSSSYFQIPIAGGTAVEINEPQTYVKDKNISPNGEFLLHHQPVAIEKVTGKDLYPDLPKSDAYSYSSLDYRHWDSWNNGTYNHVFYKNIKTGDAVDIMPNEPYYTPQAPFGGDEDYIWSNDGSEIYYVCKKLAGTDYALSTNTDIYKYSLQTKQTINITRENKGYDTSPAFSKNGTLAWLQMKTEGNEADKNDIVVLNNGITHNLTAAWDGTVNGFLWSKNGSDIYFTAPVDGTVQLFSVDYPGKTKKIPVVKQLSSGTFDITGIVGQVDEKLIVSRTDMNHATELYSFDLKSKSLTQLTHVNDALYNSIDLPKVE